MDFKVRGRGPYRNNWTFSFMTFIRLRLIDHFKAIEKEIQEYEEKKEPKDNAYGERIENEQQRWGR